MTAGPRRMGSTTYLVPPLAVTLGWAFLGETPPALAFLAGVPCLAGVYLTRNSGWPSPVAGPAKAPAACGRVPLAVSVDITLEELTQALQAHLPGRLLALIEHHPSAIGALP